MDIQTRYLRYFLAVAEELSFSRAASKLGVSQPALSQRIRDLEALFGFPLFDRAGRLVALSEQGQAMLMPARSLLSHVRQFESEITDLRTNARAPLMLGATIYSDLPERADLVFSFIDKHPDERIELETGYTLALLEALLAGEVDFAFLIGLPVDERFEALVLRWFEPEIIVPAASPLARHATIPLKLLRTCAVASFRRKRHPALFDQVIQPLISLGAAIHYAPDQTPGGILAFAGQHGMVVPSGFPMHAEDQIIRNAMVRRKLDLPGPFTSLQLARAAGHSTDRKEQFWAFASSFVTSSDISALKFDNKSN